MSDDLLVNNFRQQFPFFAAEPLCYLDSAATAQKPKSVLATIARAYGPDYATVHRGVYERSANMTLAYEAARKRVAGFLNAARTEEVVFTSGATESNNLAIRGVCHHPRQKRRRHANNCVNVYPEIWPKE